jgi:hypothetical protein
MPRLQDPSDQIVKLCELWWDTQDIVKSQNRYRPGGDLYVKGKYNVKHWWRDQLRKFLYTPFSYTDDDENFQTFTPLSLDPTLRTRLIAQLGCGIGLFYRDFLSVAKLLPELKEE